MRRAVEIFLKAHGFQIDMSHNPAGWVVCQYPMYEGFVVPEHWWIELPAEGRPHGRVLTQTLPKMDHLEGGDLDLRWHHPGSVTARRGLAREEEDYDKVEDPQEEEEHYIFIEVPVSGFSPKHMETFEKFAR